MKKVKRFIIFFFILISKIAFGQINKHHKDGTRHGLWEKKFKGTDQIRYTGNFNHGVEIGEFKFYKRGFSKHPAAIKKFAENGKVAYLKYYTQKGKVISEGKLVDRKREGKWVYYHNKTNKVMMVELYENDKLEGEQNTYYENGILSEKIKYSNGKRNGKQLVYSVKGILIKEFTFLNDKLNGENKFYNGKGELLIAGNYKNNKKTGVWKYFRSGKLVKEKQY